MMSWTAIPKIWQPLLLVATAILLVSLLTWILFVMVSAKKMRPSVDNLLILLCFSSLGATAGILAASSDSSAVAPLLPAVLSLVGGLATFLVTRQGAGGVLPTDRMIIAASVTSLSLALFVGAMIGAEMRSRADAYRESADYKKFLVDVEREVEAYKRSVSLKDAAPDGDKKVSDIFEELARRRLAY